MEPHLVDQENSERKALRGKKKGREKSKGELGVRADIGMGRTVLPREEEGSRKVRLEGEGVVKGEKKNRGGETFEDKKRA